MRSWRVERMENKNTKIVLFQDINRFAKMHVSFARVATTLTFSKGAQGQRDLYPFAILFRELPVDRHEELIRRAIGLICWPRLREY